MVCISTGGNALLTRKTAGVDEGGMIPALIFETHHGRLTSPWHSLCEIETPARLRVIFFTGRLTNYLLPEIH
jgi:hypothetical protein